MGQIFVIIIGFAFNQITIRYESETMCNLGWISYGNKIRFAVTLESSRSLDLQFYWKFQIGRKKEKMSNNKKFKENFKVKMLNDDKKLNSSSHSIRSLLKL